MPKLPRNMVRRKNRPGYYYRAMRNGGVHLISLGTDYQKALQKLRSLKDDGPPRTQLTLS